jgi:DHA2 family multidrug resistance protein
MVRGAGLFGSLFLLPIFLQTVQGREPIATGLMMFPQPVFVALFMPVAGVLTDRFGPRWPTAGGVVLLGSSLWMYGYLDPLSGTWAIIGPQIVRGMGLAFMNTPVNTAAMNAVTREDAGVASWIVTLTRMVTASVVIALVGTLLPLLRVREMERLAVASALHGPPPPPLVHAAVALGTAPAESGALVRGVLLRHVSHMANALAFQRIHLGLSLVVFTGLLPALMLSAKKGKGR